MALLRILTENDPLLRKKSKPVGEVTDRIIRLLDDMTETMRHAEGVGLAAPQVGVLRRVVVVECVPGEVIELIDPVIVESSG
ncbi:MAG: peptide deformylase, partial [Clostridia bacterium]|nr:peptide deformylase [Clostridia bacterium]